MLRYVTIGKFSTESDYSEDAVRGKIKDGVWLKDLQWIKKEDGRILVDIEGFYEWVRPTKALGQQAAN